MCNFGVVVSVGLFTYYSQSPALLSNGVLVMFWQATPNIADGLIDVRAMNMGVSENHCQCPVSTDRLCQIKIHFDDVAAFS